MSPYALELALKHYSFAKQATPFFQNISFKLEAGRLHSLTGKNGSGKSTLLSILTGSLPSHVSCEGSVHVHGHSYPLHRQSCFSFKKPPVALVNQRYDALIADQFSFANNLKFASLPAYPSPFKSLVHTSILPDFLEFFQIDFHMPACLLSGGQRQILALSMILQKSPSILLLDEPTATLDPTNARLVFQFLKQLVQKQRLTCLLISHDRELVEEFCDGRQLEIKLQSSGPRYII